MAKLRGEAKAILYASLLTIISRQWSGAEPAMQRKSLNGQGVNQTPGSKCGYFGRAFGQIAVVIEPTPFQGVLFSFITVSKTNWVLAHKFFLTTPVAKEPFQMAHNWECLSTREQQN